MSVYHNPRFPPAPDSPDIERVPLVAAGAEPLVSLRSDQPRSGQRMGGGSDVPGFFLLKVQPHGDDEFVFRVGSQRVFFKRPHTHDLGVEEVSRLRKFLKEAGPGTHVEEPPQPNRMMVVIDHHAAHVYQDFGGSRSADEHKVRPYDPFNFHHHLIHRKEAHDRGERVPEEDSFYEEIAEDITPANEIVLIGHATGKRNAADFLKEYLKTHHPDISRRVVATESADLSAVTEPEIEGLAKRHMIAVV